MRKNEELILARQRSSPKSRILRLSLSDITDDDYLEAILCCFLFILCVLLEGADSCWICHL